MESPLNVELTDCRATVNRREPELEAASLHSAAAGWFSVGRSVLQPSVGDTLTKKPPQAVGGRERKRREERLQREGFFSSLPLPAPQNSVLSSVERTADRACENIATG